MILTGFCMVRDEFGHMLIEYNEGEQIDSFRITETKKRKAIKKAREIYNNPEMEFEYFDSVEEFANELVEDGLIDLAIEECFNSEEEDEEFEENEYDEENDDLIKEERKAWEDLAEYWADPNHIQED